LKFPLPKIDDLIKEFHGKKFYSALDIKSGYFHIKVAKDSRHYLAFMTKKGLYEWNVMPFGPTNAPSVFQRAMRIIFQGLDFVKIYLDDVLILSDTFEEHMKHIQLALDRIKKYNIKLRMDKCYWAVQKLEYLGHVISPEGITPNKKRIENILKFKTPRTRKQLQKFIGMINYLAKFIPGLSTKLEILHNIKYNTKNPKANPTIPNWNADLQHAFDMLKKELESLPMLLHHPDLSKEFIIETDASATCIGSVLYQKQNDILVPIEFASRKFTETESRWDTGEKETYAIIWSIQRWRRYLIQKHFTVFSDHWNLHYLFNLNKQFKGDKFWRWTLLLQEYHFTVIRRPGTKQLISDYLSRYVLPSDNVPSSPFDLTISDAKPVLIPNKQGLKKRKFLK